MSCMPKIQRIQWILVVFLLLCRSYVAQLTPPGEPVCLGNQVVFSCEQTGDTANWVVILLSGTRLTGAILASKNGTTSTLQGDPGFRFEFHVWSESSPNRVFSELRVTAARELNGATVTCRGFRSFMHMIQIFPLGPPAAPSRVMTTIDENQFTQNTASITLTWSASSGADNYTIMVTPPLPSGESLLSTTTTSQQLTVQYNVEYSINITAQNCAGINTTHQTLVVDGCNPPTPLAHGRISPYSNGSVGAVLTFQCDTGYMPQAVVTSTCSVNSDWVPIPLCEVIDCGVPIAGKGVVIEAFNYTKFDAEITINCERSIIPMVAVCGSNGEWIPNPSSLKCLNGTLVSQCGPPPAPVNGHINSNYSSTVEGSQITFHCGGDSPVMTATCSNGSWIPSPSDMKCRQRPAGGDGGSNIGVYAGISAAIVIMLATITIVVIIAIMKKQGVRPKPSSFELDSYQDSNHDGLEYAQTRHPGPRIVNQAGEEYSVLCHSTPSENSKTHHVVGQGDTLVYADIGPSSTKCSAHHPATSTIQEDHRVVYSTLNLALQQPVKRSTHSKTCPCPTDKSLDLDSLLIQLKPQVIDKWEQFAEAVGLSNIIQQLSKYSPDECIVEVFDQWLKSHPTKPTWRNVADVLNDIGLHQLAEDILKVYETGKLPIIVDMDAIPENLTSDNGTPPPLPPKFEDSGLDCKIESVQHGERSVAVPPRPPKPPVRPPKPVF